MPQIETFMRAIRNEETGSPEGDYGSYRGPVREGRVVGAYGFATDYWDQLSGLAGLRGADWHDSKAQDAIAQAAFEHLHAQYGDWRLVAIAWKAGEAVADAVAANPKLLKDPQLAGVKEYAQKVMRFASNDAKMHEPSPDGGQSSASAFRVGLNSILPPQGTEGEGPPASGGDAPPPLQAEQALMSILRARRNVLRDRSAQETAAAGEGEPLVPGVPESGGE
jgi:hypothetical protein